MNNLTAIVWLGLMVAFVVMEATTVQLICIWFAAGSLAAMVVSLLGGAFWLQLLVFFAVSIALLAALWPLAKKHFKPKLTATNTDALIGRICTVTETIDPVEGGRVKLGDVTWSASSQQGTKIPTGAQVKILKVQGVKVFVEEVKKEVEV